MQDVSRQVLERAKSKYTPVPDSMIYFRNAKAFCVLN
jgi:hypothetical protein